jgi:chromosome segregation ATPase
MQKSEQNLISTLNHTITSMSFAIDALTARVTEAEDALALTNKKFDSQCKALENRYAEIDAQKKLIEELQNENEELNGKLATARHQLSVYEGVMNVKCKKEKEE